MSSPSDKNTIPLSKAIEKKDTTLVLQALENKAYGIDLIASKATLALNAAP